MSERSVAELFSFPDAGLLSPSLKAAKVEQIKLYKASRTLELSLLADQPVEETEQLHARIHLMKEGIPWKILANSNIFSHLHALLSGKTPDFIHALLQSINIGAARDAACIQL